MQEMQQNPTRPGRIVITGLLIILGVIAADQYTKWLVLETVLRTTHDGPGFAEWFMTPRSLDYFAQEPGRYAPDTLTSFFNLVMVWNKGISFGMFDAPGAVLPFILMGLSAVVSGVLVVWMLRVRRPLITVSAALIIGGAMANVIDRIRFRAVADFLDFHLGERHWPAFNLADSCIVIGAVLLMADALLAKNEKLPARANGAT
jgi:signal peptidase II